MSPEYVPLSESRLRQRRAARREVRTNRRVLAISSGVIAVAAGVVIAANPFPSHSEGERATEDCVSALVGHRVDLVSGDSEGNSLQIPREIYDEQMACTQNGNNPQAARERLSIQLRSR